ncbi:MAG: MFS transporter [Chloroflexi bacterium]|nr:MFS transporter [Chloroflexota bacterium]
MRPPADLRDRQHSPYRWVILAMVSLSGFVTMGFPIAGLSALLSEIAASLELDLIQIGVIWGVGMVMGIFTTFIGGSLIDHFGTRRSLVFMCLAAGVFGSLRGLAVDFWSLLLFSLLYGTLQPVLPLNFIKLNREWFASRQLGLAAGIMSLGFALGAMMGSGFSATLLSPLLGGWRAVLVAFGLSSIVMAVLWALLHPPVERRPGPGLDLRQLVIKARRVAGFRELQVIALAVFGAVGLMQGIVGYVPTYLRAIGWASVEADSAIPLFFFASLVGVAPISHLSDRLGSRRPVMIFGTSMMSLGALLMFFADGDYWTVMLAMTVGGLCFDSFMAMMGASITEARGLDMALVGSALGFGGMLQNLGGSLLPPLGNTLSVISLNAPFLLWAAAGVFATGALLSYRGRGRK